MMIYVTKTERERENGGSETIYDLHDTAPARQLLIFEIDKVRQRRKPRFERAATRARPRFRRTECLRKRGHCRRGQYAVFLFIDRQRRNMRRFIDDGRRHISTRQRCRRGQHERRRSSATSLWRRRWRWKYIDGLILHVSLRVFFSFVFVILVVTHAHEVLLAGVARDASGRAGETLEPRGSVGALRIAPAGGADRGRVRCEREERSL